MDKPKQPHSSNEEAPEVPVPPAPPVVLPARSPFRPLSRRRRQQQLPEPAPAVERPDARLVFDASPTTIAAVLARAETSPGPESPVRGGGSEPAGGFVRLTWRSRGGKAASGAGEAGETGPAPPDDAA